MASHAGMAISSPAFADGGFVPPRYTCDGENVMPPLVFSGVPAAAAALVLVVDDPDAASGSWIHFLRFNIDPRSPGIPEGGDVGSGLGVGSSSALDWSGPCPSSGEHRYYFKLYALSSKLDLPDGSTAEAVLGAMDGKILAKAGFLGRYARGA